MPLAQSTPSKVAEVTPMNSKATDTANSGSLGMGQVPFETYRFFGVNPGTADQKDLNQIKDVYDWASKDSNGLGDSLYKLRQLEIKLGQPPLGETRYSKMWNYVRISKMVNNIETDRDTQIKKVHQARQEEIKRVKAKEAEKVARIEQRRKAEELAIRKSREKELNQIRKLRQVYS